MDQERTRLPKEFYSQASQVLGEDFWQEISGLIPVPGPRVDVYHDTTAVFVLAELPGLLSADQIGIRLEGQTLELEGELPCPYPVTENRILQRERFFGPFRRALALPKPVSPDAIRAKYSRGLLVIELPLREPAEQTKINVEF
ncbi:Hsp20/alpha crystallin family protein [Cohnella candidum]|uniref:Hsp20/alpha crystallin family protein n=1 Tax=Cohnella candidum TaxID=2674991 RepID=A0A3G3JXL0_9BACL|nr:Hsp20/alpha crystallin family protein [Cohnella candidum]AYQ72988.1 Hsp20/alpha crystallin family protein [Cohnella candidum]